MARSNKQRDNALAARRLKVAQLYVQGIPQYQIAEQCAVHPGQVSRDLTAIRAEWLQSSLLNYDARKAQELARIDQLETEAWAAWERSKQPKEKRRVKTTKGLGRSGEGKRDDAERTEEARDGNPKFLAEVRACVELRGKIVGLLPTKERDPLDVLLEYLPAELAAAVRAEIDRVLSGGGVAGGGQPQGETTAVP